MYDPNFTNPNIHSIRGVNHPDWVRPTDPEAFDRATARGKELARTAIKPEFTGVPYAGTESVADMPQTVSIPTGNWVNNPA